MNSSHSLLKRQWSVICKCHVKRDLATAAANHTWRKFMSKGEELVAWEGRPDLAFAHLAETPTATKTGSFRQQHEPIATETRRDLGDSLLCSTGTGGWVPEGGEEQRQNIRVFSEAEQTALYWHSHRSRIYHPPTDSGTAGLSTLISSSSSHRQQVGREEGEAAWELGGHTDNQTGWVKEPDITAGQCCYLSANAKEPLLEQDSLSCNDRVNFKLAESFWDFFSSTVKSLGLAVANYNNMRWQSHEEWWMAEQGWKSRRSDHNEL